MNAFMSFTHTTKKIHVNTGGDPSNLALMGEGSCCFSKKNSFFFLFLGKIPVETQAHQPQGKGD